MTPTFPLGLGDQLSLASGSTIPRPPQQDNLSLVLSPWAALGSMLPSHFPFAPSSSAPWAVATSCPPSCQQQCKAMPHFSRDVLQLLHITAPVSPTYAQTPRCHCLSHFYAGQHAHCGSASITQETSPESTLWAQELPASPSSAPTGRGETKAHLNLSSQALPPAPALPLWHLHAPPLHARAHVSLQPKPSIYTTCIKFHIMWLTQQYCEACGERALFTGTGNSGVLLSEALKYMSGLMNGQACGSPRNRPVLTGSEPSVSS